MGTIEAIKRNLSVIAICIILGSWVYHEIGTYVQYSNDQEIRDQFYEEVRVFLSKGPRFSEADAMRLCKKLDSNSAARSPKSTAADVNVCDNLFEDTTNADK